MKTISISLFNRPDYTKEVLDALEKCTGVEEYKIFIKCEKLSHPKVEETIKVAQEFNHNNKSVIINERRLGCSLNIWSCLDTAFSETDTDFHIHFEDDTVPSRDCLKYFEWANKYFTNHKNVGAIAAYSRMVSCIAFQKIQKEKLQEQIEYFKNLVRTISWFIPWGWGLHRNVWQHVLKDELLKRIKQPRYDSWDRHVRYILQENELLMALPVLSRSQNIGALNGVHCPGPTFHKKEQWTPLFVEDLSIYQEEFHKIEEKDFQEYIKNLTLDN